MSTNWTRARALIALGAVVGIGAVGSLAAFTDTASFTAQFTTGSLDIDVDESEGNPTPYVFSAWTTLNMVPGQQAYAKLDVNNNGTVPFNYTMAAPVFLGTDSVALQSGLQAGIALIGAAATCNAASFAAGTVVAAPGPLNAMTITTARTLAAGTDERLCFMAMLPAASTLQGAEVNPTFTLTAVQVP